MLVREPGFDLIPSTWDPTFGHFPTLSRFLSSFSSFSSNSYCDSVSVPVLTSCLNDLLMCLPFQQDSDHLEDWSELLSTGILLTSVHQLCIRPCARLGVREHTSNWTVGLPSVYVQGGCVQSHGRDVECVSGIYYN